MTAADLAARLAGVRRHGDGWTAFCPAHEADGAAHNPSLSLKQDGDRVLLHCFGGCSHDAVLAALGLSARDLFSDKPTTSTNHRKPKLGPIVAVYDYADESGALRSQCVRYAEPEKTFRQRRPDGNGGWHWDLDGVRRVLFGLPDLLDRTDVFVVEGEKDALALRALGLAATTNPCGADNWLPTYADQLVASGCLRVVVLPDNDARGHTHGQTVAASCAAVGLFAKVITLPGLPPKGDVSDWLAAGHTTDELAALVAEAPTWTPEALPWARSLPDLIMDLAHAPDVPPVVSDFVLAGAITLLHGQPRDWKTIVALHVGLAVATGQALFGLARLSVPVARNVLYLTEEDGARRVTERLRMICAGLGCDPPDNLFVAAGTGFSLDEPESLARLIAFVKGHDIALVMPDPLRSLSGCTDQGPKELRPLVIALRLLMRKTSCAIFAVHHDSKPLAIGVDARRRPQRASGGAVFSVADAPIGIDPLPDGRRLLTPTAWKFCEDPPAIVLALESGDGWLRLAGAEANGATTAGEADLAARVLAFLEGNPRTSGTAIQKAIKGRRVDVFKALDRLAGTGRIDCCRLGRATLWSLPDEKRPEPFGNRSIAPGCEAVSMVPGVGTML